MALILKKGFRVETKTMKCRLSRVGNFIEDTLRVYRESVEFYISVIEKHPHGVDLKKDEMRKFYDILTLSDGAEYPFAHSDMPSDLRWDVLNTAVGHYKSWRSNTANYEKKEEKRRKTARRKGKEFIPHKPPKLPEKVKDCPTYYKTSMYKDDNGVSILLKVRNGNSWAWVKFDYFSYDVGSEWVKATPTIVFKQDGSCWLNWTIQKYQVATGGVKAQQDKRVCAVDIDLDGDSICTLSVLEPDVNGNVREIARNFIKGHNIHVRRRKSELGKIANKMKQTGNISSCFCSNKWGLISRRENNEGRRIAAEICKFAAKHHCAVIVFEYLMNLLPVKGKYSKRSNQKRAYWLKSKIFNFTTEAAMKNFNILTSRVSPKNTSKYCAFTNEPVFRTSDETKMNFVKCDPLNWDKYIAYEGYHPGTFAITRLGHCVHSGLNAARNIGIKFYQRYGNEKLTLVRG